jgi:hypothetical protein
VTSTDGISWGTTSTISTYESGSGPEYDFAYNEYGNYFGVVYEVYAIGTDDTLYSAYTTSSDGITWSATSSVYSDNTEGQLMHLSYADSIDLTVVGITVPDGDYFDLKTYISTNGGTSWSNSTVVNDSNAGWVGGLDINADGTKIGMLLLDGSDNDATTTTQYDLKYTSSTDFGSNWNTTPETVVEDITHEGYFNYSSRFAFDGNGNPGFMYYDISDKYCAGGWDGSEGEWTGACSVTSSLVYYNNTGTWASSTVDDSIVFALADGEEAFGDPFDLIYVDTDKPVITFVGDNEEIYLYTNTSTAKLSLVTSTGGNYGANTIGAQLAYDTTSQEIGVSYWGVNTESVFTVASLGIPGNTAPTVTVGVPSQTTGAGIVTVTTTVADADSEVTSLIVEYSTDGSIWTSSTLGTVTDTEGMDGITTSTGNIADIDTDNDTSVDLTIQWDASGLGSVDDTEVWLRFTPNDGTDSGSTVSSTSFGLDMKDPTNAGPLTVISTSTTSFVVGYGATTTDNNFSEYKIFYKEGSSGVSFLTDTAITSTTDANLGNVLFNGNTTTTFSGFATNTQYVFDIQSYDSWGGSASGLSELTFYTLATAPGTPTVGGVTKTATSLGIVLDEATNPTSTEYAIYESSTGYYLAADNGLDSATAIWQTTSTWSDPAVIGLTANTQYTFQIIARNGNNVNTATTSASAVYTLANAAGIPTIGTVTTSTLPITIDANSNLATVTYAVYNSTDSNYLDANGASTSTAVYSTTSTLGASFAATGLSPNTAYQFTVTARNVGSVDSATSTASAETYTNPVAPGTPTAVSTGATTMTVTWTDGVNGTGTVYELYNVTDSASVGTTSNLSYSVTGLTASTEYEFKVRAQYLSNTSTYTSYSATSTAVSTEATPVASSGGGGGGFSAPPTPPPAPVVATPATTIVTVTPNTPQIVSVGNTSHTVTASTPSSNGSVSITIQSNPVTITLKPGEEELVDTNSDNEDDLFVRYNSLDGDNVSLTISAIDDLEFSINQALSTTDTQNVTLYFNSSEATLVAISNTNNFANTSFEIYTPTKQWTLTEGNGEKTVYVKFRTAQGGNREVSDTITLTSQSTDQIVIEETIESTICSLNTQTSYKSPESSAVYYITPDCTKRAFTKSNVFFTYFTSWNDVKTTTKTILDSIPNDTLGFMPWGPNYDPKYGALVKIVTDPKVYLLLNTEKYWITSELVFNTLNYAWNWIEDIDQRLLNKYTNGSEITYTDHHPNYTIVKYKDSNKVYRLEPNSEGKQTKRWIPNEAEFNALNFRWDRIVTIPDTEVYETGSDLGAEKTSTEYTFINFLSQGSSGEEVKQLQIRLQELGYMSTTIVPNGNFGPSTKAAVIKLQEENDLKPSLGYVGPGTREVLNN